VRFRKYWVNEAPEKYLVLSMLRARGSNCVHREAHGLIAGNIIESSPDMAELYSAAQRRMRFGAVSSRRKRHTAGMNHSFYRHRGSTALTQSIGDERMQCQDARHDVRDALAAFGDAVKPLETGSWFIFVERGR